MIPRVAALLSFMSGAATAAPVAVPCDWRAHVANIAEPWEENTRFFANGAVRLALLDTVEPGVGPLHLMVLAPPYDEMGNRACTVYSLADSIGFASLNFPALEASYDAAVGLTFTVPVQIYDPQADDFVSAILGIWLNQATGDTGGRLE